MQWTPAGWGPALLVGLGALFGFLGWARRGAASGWAAAATLFVANVLLWAYAMAGTHNATLAVNASVALGVTAGVSWVLGGLEGWRRSSWFAGAVTVIGAVLTGYNLFEPAMALGLTAGAAVLLTWFAPKAPGREWDALATLATGLGLCCWVGAWLEARPLLWLAGAAVLLWSLPVVRRVRPNADSAVVPRGLDAMQVAVATLVTLRLLVVQFHGAALVAALAAAAALVFMLGVRPGIRSAIPASWVLSVSAILALAGIHFYSTSRAVSVWLGATVVLGWFPSWAWRRFGPAPEKSDGWWRSNVGGIETVLATLLSALAAGRGFSGAAEVLACVAVTLIALGVFRLGGVRAARTGTVALAALLVVATLNFINNGSGARWYSELGVVALAASFTALLPRWLAEGPAPWSTDVRRRAGWTGGGAGLGLWFLACLAQKGDLAPYATVGWGLAAALWFMGGLVLRTTPYRLLGLIGLGLCIPRVFFVDLESTLYRIVAFMVLGVVLLWVGFSYHRFRHLIVDAGDDADQKR